MADQKVRIIVELIDLMTQNARKIQRALRGIQESATTTTKATAQVTRAQPMAAWFRQWDRYSRRIPRVKKSGTELAEAFDIPREGIEASMYTFQRWDRMIARATAFRMLRSSLRRTGRFMTRNNTMIAKSIGGLAWTFTWATLSMMGTLWNFQWMVRSSTEYLKLFLGKLSDFEQAAYDVAYWLALSAQFGFNFAEKMGGSAKAVSDVVKSGLFLKATYGGVTAAMTMLFARAIQQPRVMNSIGIAMEKLVKVISDPKIVDALAKIITGIADMVSTILDHVPEIIETIKSFGKAAQKVVPVILGGVSKIVSKIPGLSGFGKVFGIMGEKIKSAESPFEALGMTIMSLVAILAMITPIFLPLMTFFSSLTLVLVQVMIYVKAVKTAFDALMGIKAVANVVNFLKVSFIGLGKGIIPLTLGLSLVIRAISSMILYGVNLRNVIDLLIGSAGILAGIFGSSVSWAIMSVVIAVRYALEYFGLWDDVLNTIRKTIDKVIEVLQSLWEKLSIITEPLARLVGLTGGIRGARIETAPSTANVYQTINIGAIQHEVDADAFMRKLSDETARAIRGGY